MRGWSETSVYIQRGAGSSTSGPGLSPSLFQLCSWNHSLGSSNLGFRGPKILPSPSKHQFHSASFWSHLGASTSAPARRGGTWAIPRGIYMRFHSSSRAASRAASTSGSPVWPSVFPPTCPPLSRRLKRGARLPRCTPLPTPLEDRGVSYTPSPGAGQDTKSANNTTKAVLPLKRPPQQKILRLLRMIFPQSPTLIKSALPSPSSCAC